MSHKPKTQPGFTFVELMFAIVVLGTMLSLTMSMVVGMLRFYSFSNQIRTNQENGRNVLDTMTRDIRFGKLVSPDSATPLSEVCVVSQAEGGRKGILYYREVDTAANPKRYYIKKATWAINTPSNPTANECTAKKSSTDKILNAPRMEISDFTVTKAQGASITLNKNVNSVILKLGFITGSYALNPTGDLYCDVKNIYCNKLEYNTVVNLRQSD